MTRVGLAVLLVAAAIGTASAGTYVGLGIGTAPALGSDRVMLDAQGRSLRAMLGLRFGKLSVEGALGGYDVNSFEARQASLSGKLNLPLADGFEAFGRLGLQRTWLNAPNDVYDVSGGGPVVGLGIEYRFKLGIGATAIFMDYQYSDANLEGERESYDLSARMWTVGLSVGL